jgi:hypothetical protein
MQPGVPLQTATFSHTHAVATTAPLTTTAPTIVERIEKPVVVHEKILPSQLTEVQPVIHRDIEKLEVREVVQPMRERDIAPTQVQHVQLPAQRFESRAPDAAFQAQYREVSGRIKPDVITAPLVTESIEKPALVEETIHRKIVEEVQPVLYRETLRPTVIEATKPIYEHIVEAPILSETVRPIVDLGTKVIPGGAPAMMIPTQTYVGNEPRVIIKETTTVLEPIEEGFQGASMVQGQQPLGTRREGLIMGEQGYGKQIPFGQPPLGQQTLGQQSPLGQQAPLQPPRT